MPFIGLPINSTQFFAKNEIINRENYIESKGGVGFL